MSVHEPPQFTPAQVLEAARRAEGEGRIELAHKFFLHLAENYVGTPEAAAAQAALSRMAIAAIPSVPPSQGGPGGAPVGQFSGQRGPTTARQVPAFEPPAHGEPPSLAAPMPGIGPPPVTAPTLGNPFGTPREPEPGFSQWQQPYSQPPAPAPQRHPEALPFELPAPVRDYRTGRWLARCCTWLGGIAVIAGLTLLVLAALGPRGLPLVSALGIWHAGVTIVSGIAGMLLGQGARALLDQANATRDLAALARAEAEARHGTAAPPRRSRRR